MAGWYWNPLDFGNYTLPGTWYFVCFPFSLMTSTSFTHIQVWETALPFDSPRNLKALFSTLSMQNVPWFNHPMRVNSAMFRPWLSTLNAEMLHGLPNDQVIWSEPTFGRQRLELSQEQHPEMTTFEHAACWGSGFLHPKMRKWLKYVGRCWNVYGEATIYFGLLLVSPSAPWGATWGNHLRQFCPTNPKPETMELVNLPRFGFARVFVQKHGPWAETCGTRLQKFHGF